MPLFPIIPNMQPSQLAGTSRGMAESLMWTWFHGISPGWRLPDMISRQEACRCSMAIGVQPTATAVFGGLARILHSIARAERNGSSNKEKK